jgi:hypothetical protein
MCIFCDLDKEDGSRTSAINYAEDIIDTCNKIADGYKGILSRNIKPHTDKMKYIIQNERHLIRLIIDDIL